MQKYLITAKSSNRKTGPIMVTTSPRSTCPTTCPFKGSGGCYAEGGPLRAIWSALDKGEAGETVANGKGKLAVKSLADLLSAIRQLEPGSLWRMNQAGDLPGEGNEIDECAVGEIVNANRGRRGFTYTHKPMTARNKAIVGMANDRGFTINLSANNLADADRLADLQVGPVATVLPAEQTTNTTTPKGRKVVVCPATVRDDVSCATCGLCARQRDFIIGFPAHGAAKRRASNIAAAA